MHSQQLVTSKVQIDDYNIGVYRLRMERDRQQLGSLKSLFTASHVAQGIRDGKTIMMDILRFFREIYSISPFQFSIVFGGYVWRHISDPLSTYFRAMLLHAVEANYKTGESDYRGVVISLSLFVLSSTIAAFMKWNLSRSQHIFREKIHRHFQFRLMRESLENDLATATAKSGHESVTAGEARNQFTILCSLFGNIVGIVGQVTLILDTCKRVGHPILVIISLVLPITISLWTKNIFSRKCIAYNINEPDKRMKALAKMSEGKYRQDIVVGNLAEWIITEFKKAFGALGDVPHIGHPIYEWSRSNAGPRSRLLDGLMKDLPLVYLAILSIQSPASVSLSSITILAESSLRLMQLVRSPFLSVSRLQMAVGVIRKIYHEGKSSSRMESGALSYPIPSTSGGEDVTEGGTSNKGMRFELRNVTFTYPSSQSTKPALDSVSVTIQAGQLVVLVGKNGSGKSTLIRILSRLYEHTSGEVLIDNRPSKAYHLGDLKRAIALLSQDNKIYPFTLGENIGVGYPDKVMDQDLIRTAAEDGGSAGLIAKLKDGFETKLDPGVDTCSLNLHKDPDHPLAKELEAMMKRIEISGGETQRVVASRTFMRMNSDEVKFVAVDEPTSALDAEGELHLFDRLIARREGKTMVFVTHRFGHLTKHADLVLCMDEGRLVESGSHERLMRMDGVYSKLYSAQASAYSN